MKWWYNYSTNTDTNTHLHAVLQLSTFCRLIVYPTDTVDLTELEGFVWSLDSLEYCLSKVKRNRRKFFQNPSVRQGELEAKPDDAWKSTDPGRNSGSIMRTAFPTLEQPLLGHIELVDPKVCLCSLADSEINFFLVEHQPKWKQVLLDAEGFLMCIFVFALILLRISSLNCEFVHWNSHLMKQTAGINRVMSPRWSLTCSVV